MSERSTSATDSQDETVSALLPPKKRTALGENISRVAEAGQLRIQHCQECGHWSYPPREVCGQCLLGVLAWDECSGHGKVLASVALHNSFEPYFSEHLPWPIVSVKLEAGPVVYAHSRAGVLSSGADVIIVNELDDSGAGVFWAQLV